jgi:hypothetical protein
VLFLLVLLRLDLALALIAALAPFYAFPWTLFSRAFSMAEVLTVMAFISWAVGKIAALREEKPDLHRLLSRLCPLDLAVLFLLTRCPGFHLLCRLSARRVA